MSAKALLTALAKPDLGQMTLLVAPAEGGKATSTIGDLPRVLMAVGLANGHNVWHGVQPIREGLTEGRGKAEDVAALATLYADLDDKTGSRQAQRETIAALSSMVGARPTAIVMSGHGLQPYWTLEDPLPITDAEGTQEAASLLRRWGRLVTVVAVAQGLTGVDSVWDLPRVLRTPGTVNTKPGLTPVEAVLEESSGEVISLEALRDALDGHGIPEETPQEATRGRQADLEQVEAFLDRYVTSSHPAGLRGVLAALGRDLQGERHRAMATALVWALEEAQRGDYPAREAAEAIREAWLASYGPHRPGERRKPDPWEWSEALAWAVGQRIGQQPRDRTPQAEEWDFSGQEQANATEVPAGLQRVDWDWLWAQEGGEEWLLEPLVPAGRSVTLYSPPKAGKSLLALDVAVAIAQGGQVLGMKATQAPVLYLDLENHLLGDVRPRLEEMGHSPRDLEGLHYLSFPVMAPLDTPQGGATLLAYVLEHGIRLVVLDTMSRVVEGEENANDTWLALYQHTGARLKANGVAALRLDHSGKDETKGTRGGSAKSGDVDATWRLVALAPDRLELRCEAMRFPLAEAWQTISVNRKSDPLTHHADAAPHQAWLDSVEEACRIADAEGLPKDAGWRPVYEAVRPHGISQRVAKGAARRRKEEAERVDEFPF